MDELVIDNRPLKEFFKLFKEDEALEIIALGDIWHPSSGFVDGTFFQPITTVGDLLKIDYDFKGLVFFTANIRRLSIDYNSDYYTIIGTKKEIEKLKFNDLYRLNS